MRAFVIVVFLLAGVALGAGYFEWDHRRSVNRQVADLTAGDPRRGHDKITEYGCIACHDIPGFRGPRRFVGPPLEDFAHRMYVAGAAENRPENLISFLRDPRSVVPRGAMPNLHLTEGDAADIAAYLYTLE